MTLLRWLVALPLVAVLAGCATYQSHAPAATPLPTTSTADPVPTPTRSLIPIPVPSYSPPYSPPAKAQPLTCRQFPTDLNGYWQSYAEPPATCKQAESVLPAAYEATKYGQAATVKGWQCDSDLVTVGKWNTTCTKGGLTVYMQFVYTG